MSKEMKECGLIIDDMIKSLSFDPMKPIEMNQFSNYYSPYSYVDGNGGGFMPHHSAYWKNQGIRYEKMDYSSTDRFYDKYVHMNKSEETNDALDFLIKGGVGSGRTTDPYSHLSPAALASKKLDDKAKEEKKPKKKNDEQHAKDVARLVSYMKSEDNMSKENDVLKSLGFTVGNAEEISLIQSVEENENVVKSIQNNDFHFDGRLDTETRTPVQALAKSYGDENLKNTHGEKFHKDNNKEVEKMVTTVDEVKYPKEGEEKKSRKLIVDKSSSIITEDEEKILKGMFYEYKSINEIKDAEPNKECIFGDLKWKMEDLKRMKDLAYVIEDELPEAKELFKKKYNALKKEASDLLSKYNSTKKSLSEAFDDLMKSEKKEEKKENKIGEKIANAVDEMAEGEAEEAVENHEDDMHKKSTADLLNDLIKAEAPDMRTKEKKALDAGEEAPEPEVQVDDEGNEMDDAQVEAAKELDKNQIKDGAVDKSENILLDLCKSIGGK